MSNESNTSSLSCLEAGKPRKWKKHKPGSSERDALIIEYLPLIKFIANRIASRLPRHVEVTDLVNDGVIGLIDAIEKFDPKRKIKFKTYAEFRVKGAILDGLRSLDPSSRWYRQQQKHFQATVDELSQQLQRIPTDTELCEYLDISLEELATFKQEANTVTLISLDQLTESGNDNNPHAEKLLDVLEDHGAIDARAVLDNPKFMRAIKKMLKFLPLQHRFVLVRYYFEGYDLKTIGKMLKVTESRASQLRDSGIVHLRDLFRNSQKLFEASVDSGELPSGESLRTDDNNGHVNLHEPITISGYLPDGTGVELTLTPPIVN